MERAHAKLSASGSKRWLSCPPSAKLEEQFPDEQTVYAAEGSFAHELGELILKQYLGLVTDKQYKTELKKLEANKFHSKELADHVQTYVDIVIEKINAARMLSPDAIVLLEQRLDFSFWVPEGFGTGDVVIISAGIMEVIDLKYGKGVAVSAEGNTQMRLYGLGAYNQFDILYGLDEVAMTIVQPRLDSVSTETLQATELLHWAETEVRPKAQMAMDGKGEFASGDHCKFCKARHTCRARAEENLKLESYNKQDPFLLGVHEVADVLGRVDELVKWAKEVKEYALQQAEKHGVEWPGWKLVEGKSNRTFTDEEAVAKALMDAGYKDEAIFEKSLYGITKLTEIIGKKPFSQLLDPYIIKPPGKPTLAPLSDKRPAISSTASAQVDFAISPDSNVFKPEMSLLDQHKAVQKVISGRG